MEIYLKQDCKRVGITHKLKIAPMENNKTHTHITYKKKTQNPFMQNH